MSVNKVILIGNVGKDPEVRYLDNNVAVANFPLATTERGYTTRAGVQVPDRTEWHNIVLWRGLAETAEKYVDGATRYITEIYADNMQLLGRRSDQPAGDSMNNNMSMATPSQPAATPTFTPTDASDDLPF